MWLRELKDVGARLVTGAHGAVFDLTDGRIGGSLFGMTALRLTTTGRKTGKRRTTMLTTPVHDDDTVVLVASYMGDGRDPKWLLNLRADPEVEVVMAGRRRRMRARVATAEEKAELWPRVVEAYRGYDAYQRRTDRDIPLVVLEAARPPSG